MRRGRPGDSNTHKHSSNTEDSHVVKESGFAGVCHVPKRRRGSPSRAHAHIHRRTKSRLLQSSDVGVVSVQPHTIFPPVLVPAVAATPPSRRGSRWMMLCSGAGSGAGCPFPELAMAAPPTVRWDTKVGNNTVCNNNNIVSERKANPLHRTTILRLLPSSIVISRGIQRMASLYLMSSTRGLGHACASREWAARRARSARVAGICTSLHQIYSKQETVPLLCKLG